MRKIAMRSKFIGYCLLSLIAVATLFCAAVYAASTARAEGWNAAAMNEQIEQTNFLVNDNCSATLIDKDRGFLLTANHCIRSQFRVIEREKIGDDGVVKIEKVRVAKEGEVTQISFKGADEMQRTSYTFKIIASDRETDLALLQVRAKLANRMAAKVACNDSQRGDPVYAVGNPFAVLYSSVTNGIVSSINRNYKMLGIDDQGDHALVQSSAVIFGGNSGGALYNDKGELVGVNVRGTPGITFSVPISDVKDLLGREGLNDLFKSCG
jgi:S1-C subfamily serine protease